MNAKTCNVCFTVHTKLPATARKAPDMDVWYFECGCGSTLAYAHDWAKVLGDIAACHGQKTDIRLPASQAEGPKLPKKKKPRRAPKSDELRRDTLITIKVSSLEYEVIAHHADKYAGGNISKFLRHAAMICRTKVPTKKQS